MGNWVVSGTGQKAVALSPTRVVLRPQNGSKRRRRGVRRLAGYAVIVGEAAVGAQVVVRGVNF